MKTRMEKYYNKDEDQRTHKNEDLYKTVNQSEIDQFNLNSNMSVIGDSKKSIDVEALKDILDKRYNQTPTRKSIIIEDDDNEIEEYVDDKKDYDINMVLEKARNQKRVDYNEDRLKKGSNIDFEEMNYTKKEDDEVKIDDQLMTLINTIANNELKPLDPLDILTDLKGDEDTLVVEGTIKKFEKFDTKTLDSLDNLKGEVTKEKAYSQKKLDLLKKEDKSNLIDDSFYTSSMKLKKKDLEITDDELEGSTKGVKILITILSIIAIILFISGIILLLNNIFDWNLLDYFRK